jgi:hypothetical protein
MANFEKIVKVTDAVLDCIPIVSSLTNAAHAIYKLAHKVDALSPVAPGLKTSIKIHSLSKDNFDCFVGFVPILGNIFKLVELVLRAILRFDYTPGGILGPTRDDDLLTAVGRNNKEIVHLCLGNNALDDPDRADSILRQAAYCSSNEVFRQVFNHRNDWNAKRLVNALRGCGFVNDTNALNATDVLDFWTAHGRVLDAKDMYSAISTIEDCLKRGRVALAGRVIGILPGEVSFYSMKDILLKYSCSQYNSRGEVEETGVLTAEQRNALIAKSTRPSLEQLKEYYGSVGYQLSSNRTADDYRETHFDTLNKLLDLAQLQSNKIEEFIARTVTYDEFAFIEPLVTKYEGQLSPQSKVKILKGLLPSDSGKLTSHEKRVQLFASWVHKWQHDISAQAHKLHTDISVSGDLDIEVAQDRFQMFAGAERDYPSVENLQAVNAQFKQILLDAFPACDQAPQEEAEQNGERRKQPSH